MYTYNAEVIKVYDGDTITVNIDLGFGIIKSQTKIRLLGIDTPELRGEEREAGLEAKKALMDLIMGKTVTIVTEKDKTGKYGRYLGTIFLDNTNINLWMLDHGYAKPYGS